MGISWNLGRLIRDPSYSAATRVSLKYLVFSILWILLSDFVLIRLAGSGEMAAQLQTYKGLAFVTITAAFIFFLVRQQVQRLVVAHSKEAAAADQVYDYQEKLKLALDSARVGFWTLDLVQSTISCDERAAGHFGVGEMAQADLLFERVHPDDQQSARERWIDMRGSSQVPHEEYRIKQADGVYRWVAIDCRVVKAGDAPQALSAFGISQDIHDRKHAEDSLRASEALMKSVTDNTGIGIVVLDARRRYTFVNPAYSKIFDVDSDIVGKGPETVLASVYQAQIAKRLDQAFAGEQVRYELTRPAKEPGGASKTYSIIYDPQRSTTGSKVSGVVVTAFEITELRRSEEALRKSEERLKSVMAATGEGIWDWSIETGMVEHNQQWCEILGLGDEFLQHSFQILTGLVHPEDQSSFRSAIEMCLKGKAPFFSEHRIRRGDGTFIWARDRGNVVEFTPDGRALRMAGSMIDITPAKAAEARKIELMAILKRSEEDAQRQRAQFQSIFENTPDGIVVVDMDGTILSANPALGRLFEFDAAELTGRSTRCLYASDGDWAFVETFMQSGRGFIELSLNCVNKNGQPFPCKTTVTRMAGQSGEMLGYLCTIRDVSSEQRREQVLREKQRLEALGRLTGGIAHDFNNLLTVVNGNIQLVGMSIRDDRLKHFLHEASRAAEMGARLNQRLMTFARQRRLDPVPVNINALIESLDGVLRGALGETIQFTTELASQELTVCVDASEMENAIFNLTLNARDAMPGGGRFSIQTRYFNGSDAAIAAVASEWSADSAFVRLTVSDTGNGMSEAVISRAFEPFFSTKEEGKGMGLGLATIHGFVRQSGGSISISSELGSGTTVDIYLPSFAEAPTAPKRAEVSRIIRGHGETVLVVEDNPAVRAVTMERLKQIGYTVVASVNGRAALEFIEQGGHFDLIFSDIIMPGGVSGFELAAWIKNRNPALRILLTSGFAGEAVPDAESVALRPHILEKPYTLEDLSRAIAAALDL